MFSHVIVGVNDLEASRTFYDALLGALGMKPGVLNNNGVVDRYFYRSATGSFGITKPLNGEPATHANGGTIGFNMASPEQADDKTKTADRHEAQLDAPLANGGSGHAAEDHTHAEHGRGGLAEAHDNFWATAGVHPDNGWRPSPRWPICCVWAACRVWSASGKPGWITTGWPEEALPTWNGNASVFAPTSAPPGNLANRW